MAILLAIVFLYNTDITFSSTAQFTLDVYGHVTQKMRQDSANRMQKFYEQLSSENAQ